MFWLPENFLGHLLEPSRGSGSRLAFNDLRQWGRPSTNNDEGDPGAMTTVQHARRDPTGETIEASRSQW
jgi:hypothetical protein